MSVESMQDAALTLANLFTSSPIEVDKPTDLKVKEINVPEKIAPKRKIHDIPPYKFKMDGPFCIPLTPQEIRKYEEEIAIKREKLRVHDNIRDKEASLRNLLMQKSPPPMEATTKRIKSIDEKTAQEIELMYQMMEEQQKRVLEVPDPEKLRLVKEKLAKMKSKAPKKSSDLESKPL